MATRSHRRTYRSSSRTPAQGTLVMAGVFALLVGINVYFFFYRGGTSLRDLLRASEIHKEAAPPPPRVDKRAAAALPAAARAPEVELPDEGRVAAGTLAEGDTLASLLAREGVPSKTASDVTTALGRVLDARSLHGSHDGQAWRLSWDAEDRLRAFELRATPASFLRVEWRGEVWRASKVAAPLETTVATVSGTIETNLADAVKRAGETPALVAALVEIFAWDVDFYTDPQPGDRFRVVVEKLELDGKFYKYGRVLAAEWSGRAGTLRTFAWQTDGKEAGWYTSDGESLVKSLLRSPLEYVRIATKVDVNKLRPVARTERGHVGVAYAAPVGTPVWATSSGRVSMKALDCTGGSTVEITHPGGMVTSYQHLRLAKGLEIGQPVRQKQVLGYVAPSPGGSHLHLSVKMGGHFVDPLRLRAARSAPLPASERVEFQRAVTARLAELARAK